MRHFLYSLLLASAFLFSSGRLYAQMDVDTIFYGNSLKKITSLFGNPLEREEFDGEGGRYISVKYPDFFATILKDEGIEGIIIFSDKICVLSSVIPGGIRIGDEMSKYKDFDFTARLTGKHYEANGFIKLSEPYREYPSERIFNYGILSNGIPYRVRFSVEAGVIKEILLDLLDDYPPQDTEEEIIIGQTIAN